MGGAGKDGWLRMALAASNPVMCGLQRLSGALCRRVPTATMAAVQALQDAGALLVGKATLHEIGKSVAWWASCLACCSSCTLRCAAASLTDGSAALNNDTAADGLAC